MTSVGRNRFLQRATGLFGGDEWTIGTYTAVDDHYRRSDVYSRTVTVWREQTNAASVYQRDPTACWYAMDTATVAETYQHGLLRLQWSVSEALWNTARVPGQTMTVVLHGLPVHATVLPSSTPTLAVVRLPSSLATVVTDAVARLAVGDALPYMLRARPPTTTLLGPVVRTGPNTVRLQAPANAVPTQYQGLLYLGGRSDRHPLYPCQLQTPAVARASIYGVVSVATVSGPVTALRSTTCTIADETWAQLTQHLAVGALTLQRSAALTGYTFTWPYPVDQNGEGWLIVPVDPSNAPPVALPLDAVWFVRGAGVGPFVDGVPDPTVDGVALVDGDRVLRLDNNGDPVELLEWDAAALAFQPTPLPSDQTLLLVVERDNGRCWLRPAAAGPLGPSIAYRYVVASRAEWDVASASSVRDVDLTATASGTQVTHAFVLLVRASNGLYAPTPDAAACNLYTYPSGWTFPVVTADGTDRLNLAGLSGGLIVLRFRPSVSSSVLRFQVSGDPVSFTDCCNLSPPSLVCFDQGWSIESSVFLLCLGQ